MFNIFLDFVYTGYYKLKKEKTLPVEKAICLLEVSKYFGISDPSFDLIIENYIMEIITITSCMQVLNVVIENLVNIRCLKR